MPIAKTQPAEIAVAQPLSDSQREIWFAAQMSDAASAAFNQSFVLNLKGTLDYQSLSDALDALMARHDALRTTFSPIGDEQQVHRSLPLLCPVIDFSHEHEAARHELVQERFRREVQTPFDLTKGPMLRAVLIKLGPSKHLLVLTVHHLICDGTSVNMLIRELAEEYSTRKAHGERPSKPWPMQFSEFVAQQLQMKGSGDAAEQYWLRRFEQPAPFLDLPPDRPRPKMRTFKGGGGHLKLDRRVFEDFKRLAARNRCTMYVASLAAFYVMLHRLIGQTDLVVGVPMSARSTAGSHDVVGHCVNFLPLRLSVAGNPSFAEHLTNVRRMLLDAFDHANYNFGRMIQKLNLPRHPTRAPLVSTMFNIDHIPKAVEWYGLEMELTPNPFCLTNFDFSLSLEDRQGKLEARCLYAADMFEASTIARWLRHFETLLGSIVANPQCPIAQLPLLTSAEQRNIMKCSGTEEHLIQELLPEELAALTRPGTPELEMYVLDGNGELAVPGVQGELCIAGLPLSRVQLRAVQVIDSPFSEHNGRPLFRTGCKAKYLGNGDVEVLEVCRSPVETFESGAAPAETLDSEVETKLAAIWREVMGLETIAATDDFFDIGGHSLLITQIIGRVRQTFGVQLALRDFFETPTIRELSGVIEAEILRNVEELPETEAQQLAAGVLTVR